MKKLSATACAGLLLVAAGCQVNQQRDVAEYRKILDRNIAPTTAPAANEPLTLARAMALANQTDEQLGLSGEDYVQALIQKNRAVAAFLPTVSLQPGFTLGDRPSVNNPGGNPSGINTGFRVHGDTIHRLEVPVVGNINVFRGFGDIANLHAVEAVIAQRRELLLDLQATILVNVAQTYYQVLRSEAAVGVLEHSVQLQQDRLTEVEQQFRNGLATRLAVAQTRSELDATRVTLIQAQSDVRNGRSTLALLIGMAAVPNPLIDGYVVPANVGVEEVFEQLAVQNRQDLIAAASGLEAARREVDVAISEYYPSVSLDVNGFLYREFYADASKWNALLSANLPIFSAGLIEADVRTAWSRLRQAALNESSVRRDVLHDVQVAYENLQTSRLRLRELADEVDASQESYNQALQAFRAGLATNLDAVAAQDSLLNAQLQLTGVQFDQTVFYLDLIRATGGLPLQATFPATAPASQP
ncbi:MAG TPA: TolC family protein [Tepidisphaeraceae bacterium]|nr:TolC family protein [Tepidisphaeraceae bacterium]